MHFAISSKIKNQYRLHPLFLPQLTMLFTLLGKINRPNSLPGYDDCSLILNSLQSSHVTVD